VGASIGIVLLRPGMRPADALRQADAACYAAKRIGGDRVHVSEGTSSAVDRPRDHAWPRRVVRAVEDQRFQLYAQPLVPLRPAGGGAGAPRFELLLRLEETPGAAVPPQSFLPAVRRYGLMASVDEWVVREAVRRLGEWAGAHPSRVCPTLAVNLSEETVASGTALALVEGALGRSQVPAAALCFEVGEATVVSHPAVTADLFHRLRAAGCRTTVEHCGTGMAAFTHLRRLRPDYLKMAGHIVRSLEQDPVQHALATALNQVGHVLGLGTIGFRVEDPGALEHLRHMGVDYAQGFGVGRPAPFAEAMATLE
jgi:EAL domain-containing protein (putative c-di-GMP-specific phosphodiesterase class I)